MAFEGLNHGLLVAQLLHSIFDIKIFINTCWYIASEYSVCQPTKLTQARQTHACFPVQKLWSQNKFKSSAVILSTTSYVESKGWKKKKNKTENSPSAVTGKTPEGRRKGIRKKLKCSFPFYCVSDPIFLALLCLSLLLFVASLHVLEAL